MAELTAVDAPDALSRAEQVLRSGGLVVLPTDTVYGLAALATSSRAMARMFEVKRRPVGMHVAVLVANAAQLVLVSDDPRPAVAHMAERFWPGALTLVVPHATELVGHLGTDDGTVGVRCPDHRFARSVADRVGPIATTSANLHGERTPETVAEIAEHLVGVDLIIDGGRCRGGTASTVVSLVGSEPLVLREGPVSEEAVMGSWYD